MPLFPLSLGGGGGFVFVFRTHRRTRGVHIFVHGRQKRTINVFKLIMKIFFLPTDVKSAKTSVSGNGEHLSFLFCKKKKVRNFEKYRLMPNGCQKISKNRIHGCRNSNPKIYKHRILRLTTNKHRFSSRKSTLKTHHSDKSCIPLRVCIKQRDATFSDCCLCSCAPIGILFSQTIIEDFLRHLCILHCFRQAYSIQSTNT